MKFLALLRRPFGGRGGPRQGASGLEAERRLGLLLDGSV